MKALRALMLAMAISVCAYAGVMPNGAAGDMDNVATETAVTEAILSLLQSVLSAF